MVCRDCNKHMHRIGELQVELERYRENVSFSKEDWKYICDRINWGLSNFDAKAISILNNPHIKRFEESG